MNFLFPEFLYALGFLLVPVLIHLFNFRRYKTVKFTQVRFLKTIKQETQSIAKIKHLLVLIARCLAFSALIIAFAQPFLKSEDQLIEQGKKGVSIYLDNSFSMEVIGENGKLIDIAKKKAIAIISSYSASDKYHILTNDFKGKNQRWLNQEQAILAIQEVQLSPLFRELNQVTSRINQLDNKDNLVLNRYLITDLQKNSFDLNKLSDTLNYSLLPIKSQVVENISLDKIQFKLPYHLPNQIEAIDFTLKHPKDLENKITGQLFLNQQLKTPLSTNLSKGDSTNVSINFKGQKTDQVLSKLTIKDYPVTFDDTLYFNYTIQKRIKVLHIFEENVNKNILALFQTDSLIDYRSNIISQIDFSVVNNSSFLILDDLTEIKSGLRQELLRFIENGGSLAIFPSSKMNVKSFNEFFNEIEINGYSNLVKDSIVVSQINKNANLFVGVFEELPNNLILPKVNQYWKINTRIASLKEDIAFYPNQNSFLSKFSSLNGKVYLSSVGLANEQSNFTNHALFVPIIYNMALQSVNPTPIYYNLNQGVLKIPAVKQSESPIHIVGNGIDVIPKQKYNRNNLELTIHNLIPKSGHYNLTRDNKVLRNISFNYDRNESELSSYEIEELKELIKILGLNITIIEDDINQLSSTISKIDNGTALWKYFVILALSFLSIEILLLRFLK